MIKASTRNALKALGWCSLFEDQMLSGIRAGRLGRVPWSRNWKPVRIRADYGIAYEVMGEGILDDCRAILSGGMRMMRHEGIDRPGIGDWVAMEGEDRIVGCFDRKSAFVRKAAGEDHRPQLLAANIDMVFVVTSLNKEFNVRRLERYLSGVETSGATPVIVLSKADLVDDVDPYLEAVAKIAPNTASVVISTIEDTGGTAMLDALKGYLKPGRTVALVGSSGVGKSTITNQMMEENVLKTSEIRAYDDEGRHTTTHREMVLLPENRGLLIDTPGMREFGLWGEEGDDGIDETFSEVTDLSKFCRFRNCRHENEPGCAVLEAVKLGKVAKDRLDSWRMLREETEQRTDNKRRRYKDR